MKASRRLFDVQITKTNMALVTNLQKNINAVLRREIPRLSKDLRRTVIDKYMSAKSPRSLGRVSGKLARSVQVLPVTGTEAGVEGGITIGRGVPYAGIHIGPVGRRTVITPKRAGALAVPLPSALISTGKLRAEFDVGSLRAVSGLFRIRNLLMRRRGSELIPYFVLRKSVTIPTRVFPEQIVMEETPIVAMLLQRAIDSYLKQRQAA
jgi:hypothetical protein